MVAQTPLSDVHSYTYQYSVSMAGMLSFYQYKNSNITFYTFKALWRCWCCCDLATWLQLILVAFCHILCIYLFIFNKVLFALLWTPHAVVQPSIVISRRSRFVVSLTVQHCLASTVWQDETVLAKVQVTLGFASLTNHLTSPFHGKIQSPQKIQMVKSGVIECRTAQ